ncbi:MAG: hypothetical protein KKD73_08330 [Proteobacteria bacterium]|nr:hypothetical protein [Pseudomonadota bacterium]MBU1638858.1 hypothetical protein [Pseudomonadota bacterium]
MTIYNKATYIGLLFAGILLGLTSVLQAAVIVQHPFDQKGTAGAAAEFTVVVDGTNVTYQWTRDGSDIAGATSPSYAIAAITLADNEAWFRCRVTDGGGSQISLEAQLVVFQKGDYDWDGDIDDDDVEHLRHNIGKHFGQLRERESSKDRDKEKSKYFGKKSEHDNRKDKEKKKDKKKKDKDKDEDEDEDNDRAEDEVSAAEIAEFDWNGDNRINGKDLRILEQQCTNPNCQVIEPQPPVIVKQPESAKMKEGSSEIITVEALGPDLQYQWQKNGADIPGANRNYLRLRKVPYQDNGSRYRCLITNEDGSTTSREAVLNVYRKADLDWDCDVDDDDLKRFHGKHGQPWFRCPECDLDDDRVITNWDLQDVEKQCDAPDCDNDKLLAPKIIQQPRDQSVVENTVVIFEVVVVGKALTYQWFRNGGEIEGATQQKFLIRQPEMTDNGASFQCKITSGDVSQLTDEVTLSVYQQGDFDWDRDIDEDDARVVRALLWKLANKYTEANFDDDWLITLKDLRHLMRLCSCPQCQEPQPAAIVKNPENTTVLEGTPAIFTVEASGIRLTYQWQVNGVDIPGATLDSYTLPVAQLLDHGKLYSCIITNAGGPVTTQAAELQVEMDVPPNDVPVTGLSVVWQQDKALLNWQLAEGMRYQIQRGKNADDTKFVSETDQTTFLDDGAAYYFGWYYRLATIKDYFHPVSNKAYHAVGPLSEPFELKAQPSPTVQLSSLAMQEDGSYLAYFIAGTEYRGSYRNMDDPVLVTAGASGAVVGSGAGGSFTLTLPAAGSWQIDIVEPNGYRSAKALLLLKKDTTAPKLVLHSGVEMTTSASTITISGEALETESGLQSISVESSQYGQAFAGFFAASGSFQIDVPVKTGANNLTVVVRDKSGNESRTGVSVLATIPALPQLAITSPLNGATVNTDTITVSGTVRSSLPPENIRLLFNNQVFFPEGSEGNYHFSFEGYKLTVGTNAIKVTAETPYANVSAQSVIAYTEPEPPPVPEPPAVEIFSAKPDSFITTENFQISGFARGTAAITSVMINGMPVTLTGSGNEVSFEATLAFAGQQELEITVVVTDSNGEVTTLKYTVNYDDGPPSLELATALQAVPQINSVLQTPFTLQGTVSDQNLAGFSINDQTVGLLPAEQGVYRFNVDLDLVRGQESLFSLKAWDKAGNTSSKGIALRLDSGLGIEIVSPKDGVELNAASDITELDISFRVPGMADDDQFIVLVDGQQIGGLIRSATNIHGLVPLSLADGHHDLTIEIATAAGVTLAKTVSIFVIIDTRLVPLALERQEPANNESGVENNGFIGFYFNKTIDPALLDIEVLETFHGMDYAKAPQGADMTSLSKIEMIEVHRDREEVAGALSHFPAKTMAAFYPVRNFAFGATVYVNVSYDGQELANNTFKVKALPTFVQGFIGDQFSEPVEGLTLSIPELKRSTISDKDGSFSFGFGDPADQTIPAGRYKVIANPGMANRIFGTIEFWATVESGRLNEIGMNNVPFLNTQEPFRHITSGDSQAILAGGELILDLSSATLTFSDGSTAGNAHAQFLPVNEQPYAFINSAAPQWVFNLNPNGIGVTGHVGVKIKMPTMVGSHEYVNLIGERVVLVGFDGRSLQIVPVGVGKVDTAAKMVVSEGITSFQRLDIIGYGLVDKEQQPILEAFSKGEINLNELINRLENI